MSLADVKELSFRCVAHFRVRKYHELL